MTSIFLRATTKKFLSNFETAPKDFLFFFQPQTEFCNKQKYFPNFCVQNLIFFCSFCVHNVNLDTQKRFFFSFLWIILFGKRQNIKKFKPVFLDTGKKILNFWL